MEPAIVSKNPKVTVVEAYIKALCEHDLVAIDTLFDDQASVEDPVGSEPIQGKEAILGFYKTAFSSGISARADGAVRLAANHAVFPFIVELNPGNGEMRLEVIDQFSFNEDNKIIAMKAFWGQENISTP